MPAAASARAAEPRADLRGENTSAMVTGSAPFEVGQASFGHGPHALPPVLGGAEAVLFGAGPRAMTERTSATSSARMVRRMLATASGRRRRSPGRRPAPWRAKLRQRGDAIHQPDRERLLALEPAPGVEQLERLLLADDARQRGGEHEAVVEPEPGEVGGEARLRGPPPGSPPPATGRARRRSLRPAPRPRSACWSRRTGRRRRTRRGAVARRRPLRRLPGDGCVGADSRRRRRSACPVSTARWPGTASNT